MADGTRSYRPIDRPPRSILVVRFSSLGDVVLTLPAVEALRDAWPDARITFLADTRFAPVIAGCPAVDAVVALDRRGLGRMRGTAWRGLLGLIRKLVGGSFDCVVDLHSYTETGLLTLLSHARTRVGRRVKARGFWYSHFEPTRFGPRLISDQHVELLRTVGLIPADALTPPLRLVPDTAAGVEVADWLAGADPPARPLALFPGASRADKRWPADRFAALVREAVAAGYADGAAVFGGPAEDELCGAIADGIGEPVPVVVTPPFRPMPFVAALQRLRPVAFVSGDTGPLHLAVASGACPTVALYREPNPQFEHDRPHVRLYAPEQAGEPGSVSRIAVADVLAALRGAM